MAGGRGGGVFEFISQARSPRKGGNYYNTGGKRKFVHVCVVYSLDIKEQCTHEPTSLSHTHKDRLLLLQGRKNTLV